MDRLEIIKALRATGERLPKAQPGESIAVVLGGAVAAMLVGNLPSSRITHDCDVLLLEPDALWDAVHETAQEVARLYDLPDEWFNRDSRMYAHLLPPGWRGRCQPIGTFGPLTVAAIGRRDLMAMKLISAIVRPQDIDDLVAMKPTATDILFLRANLDRLQAESLARDSYDAQRSILDRLEQHHEPA